MTTTATFTVRPRQSVRDAIGTMEIRAFEGVISEPRIYKLRNPMRGFPSDPQPRQSNRTVLENLCMSDRLTARERQALGDMLDGVTT